MAVPPLRGWLGAALGSLLASVALSSTAASSDHSPSKGRASKEAAVRLEGLWVEPRDLAKRDLFWGPGGRRQAPRAEAEYRFLELDDQGFSPGYEVEGPDGRQWKVKVGKEAASEIVASRVLWAIGYRQPATYFLPVWRMRGGPTATPEPGRFRLESDHDKEGSWSWSRNPYLGTQPLAGLLVANLVLNNWDLDADNNRIYEPKRAKGAKGAKERWYVVQDVGAALGKSSAPFGSRNEVADFESQDLILGVRGGRVLFDHHSLHAGLYDDVTPADVVWACRWLSRLSDRQWRDAFRAGGYPDEIATRYLRQIRRKLDQGLALERPERSAG